MRLKVGARVYYTNQLGWIWEGEVTSSDEIYTNIRWGMSMFHTSYDHDDPTLSKLVVQCTTE